MERTVNAVEHHGFTTIRTLCPWFLTPSAVTQLVLCCILPAPRPKAYPPHVDSLPRQNHVPDLWPARHPIFSVLDPPKS